MRNKSCLLITCLSLLFTCSIVACSNNDIKANDVVPTNTTTSQSSDSASSPKTTTTQNVDYRKTLNLVDGKECNIYFDPNAASEHDKTGFYMNTRRSIFVGDDGVILANLMLKHGKLQIVANFFYVDKQVCIDEFSPMFVTFDDEAIHSIGGLQKTNCKKVKDKSEPGAIGMYHLPINSKLFKKLLFAKPSGIAVNATKGMTLFKAYDEKTAKEFQNAIRCAYEALGHKFDLANDDLLVETVLPND